MKKLKFVTILLLLSLIIACEKDDDSEKYKIDNDVEFYKDYVPDLVIQKNDSVPIDVDNDGSMDIAFLNNSYGTISLSRLNNDFNVSIGSWIGSGTGNLDAIEFNENITESQEYSTNRPIYTNMIEYVGLRKKANNQLNNWVIDTSYGWIKINVGEESVTIEELYFRKEPGTVVRAGIKEYE